MKANVFKSSDFIRFKDAAITHGAEKLLDAAIEGAINPAAYADGWFAWTAKVNERGFVERIGANELVQNVFLFPKRDYLEKFKDAPSIQMGMFRTDPLGEVDRWCELRGGMKPDVELNSLRILKSDLARSFPMRARAKAEQPWVCRATELWDSVVAGSKRRPTKVKIADKVAELLKAEQQLGRGNRPVTGETIRRKVKR